MRVLHVAETAQGGVGSYLDEILPRQSAVLGLNAVRVILPRKHARHLSRIPSACLLPFEIAPKGRLRHIPALTSSIQKLLRDWKPDIIHAHSTIAGVVVRVLMTLYPKSERPKIVYCAHGWAFDRVGGRIGTTVLAAVVERWLSHFCEAIVCVSQKDRDRALAVGIAAHKLTVIMNGIEDAPLRRPSADYLSLWPPGTLRVLFVGRLDRQKGADILCRTLQSLEGKAHAVVVGSAVVFDQDLGWPGNCSRLGWLSRETIHELYAAADLLLMPSRWEGLPITAIEAMRAGLPVVSSCVGGLPEIVIHGKTGLLVPSNDPEDFARLLSSLSKHELAPMGQLARQHFQRCLRVNRVSEETDAVYRKLTTALGASMS
jgi:glycosyltransferase involved in cell wall biosynthesis